MVGNRTSSLTAEQHKKVFFGFGPSHLTTFPGQNFMTERADAAGCMNVAAGNTTGGINNGKIVPPQAEVSLEQVIAWDPDLIVIDTGNVSEILQDPHWQTIKAVRTGNVVLEPEGIFKWSRPNPESAALYPVWLAATAYPARFTDIDMGETVRGFYREFFDYDLNPEQTGRDPPYTGKQEPYPALTCMRDPDYATLRSPLFFYHFRILPPGHPDGSLPCYREGKPDVP